MFDVCKSHVEKEEFVIKVGSFLFSNQNCIRKVKVRHSACLVRQEKLLSSVIFFYIEVHYKFTI